MPQPYNRQTLTCLRCGQYWTPRKSKTIRCARCNSIYWNMPAPSGLEKRLPGRPRLTPPPIFPPLGGSARTTQSHDNSGLDIMWEAYAATEDAPTPYPELCAEIAASHAQAAILLPREPTPYPELVDAPPEPMPAPPTLPEPLKPIEPLYEPIEPQKDQTPWIDPHLSLIHI